MLGAALVAATEIFALAAVLPLMQLLAGEMPSVGPLGPADELLGLGEQGVAVTLASFIFGAYFVKGAVGMAYRWWVGGFIARQQVDTASRLLNYYLKTDYSLHLRRTIGDFVRRMNDAVQQTYSGVAMGSISVATEGLTVVAILTALIWAEPIIAALMILYFAIASTAMYLLTHAPARNAGMRQLQASEKIFRYGIEPLENIKDVMLRGNSGAFVKPYRRVRWEGAMAGRVAAFLTEVPKFVLELIFISGVACLTTYLFLTSPSSESIATLALFALAGFRFLPALARLLASINNIKVNTAGFHMVLDEMVDAERVSRRSAETLVKRAPFTQSIILEDVYFSYPGHHEMVLKGLSITIPRGGSVGIVGGSGAGKSTLIDIILGFHRPTSGRLLIDGVDYSDDLRPWQRHIGMVPQDVFALVGTVTDNISFRAEAPDLQRAERAARQAHLHDFIVTLPDGYKTVLGPGGMGLSGGQKQRLGLARALYRDPSVLILDEATSALDNETEHQVTEAIRLLRSEVTTLVIAHRLSTVKHCDQILYLEGGKVAAHGTFVEVYRENPNFARLVDLGSLKLP